MSNQILPLVKTDYARRESYVVGDLVTVELWAGKDKTVQSGAVVERIVPGTVFVKLCGLTVPAPYAIGERYPLNTDKVVD